MSSNHDFMRRAIALATEAIGADRGGPFGAVIVRDGQVIAEGTNRVTSANDPTAHAEMVAIRAACGALGSFSLAGAEIFSSCEPCPMCLGAIYWARLDRLWFANSRADAAAIGFDDAHIYSEIALPIAARAIPTAQLLATEARTAFAEWAADPDKTTY